MIMITWPTKKLGELCEIKIGKTPRRGVVKYWTSGTLPWVKIAEVKGAEITNTNEQITETAAKELNMSPFPKGTVLYTFKLSIGRVGIAGVDLFTNEAIAGFIIKDRKSLLSEWLFYVLPLVDYRPFLSNAVKGNTLNKSSLKLLPISLPPLKIQKQIVERMDKIAEAQKLNDELIKKSDELFQSLLHKELQFQKWPVIRLGEIAKFQYGYTESANDKGNFRFIRITDIDESGELREDEKKYIQVSADTIKPYILRAGDIVVARTGATFGKMLYFNSEEPSVFASYLIRIESNGETLFSNFLWLFSRTPDYWRQANNLMTGSGQQQFNANKIGKIKIPLPSLKIQKQIVAKLSAAQEYKRQLLEQKLKLKELFVSVLDKLMKGEMD